MSFNNLMTFYVEMKKATLRVNVPENQNQENFNKSIPSILSALKGTGEVCRLALSYTDMLQWA